VTVSDAGPNARFAYEEFFAGINSGHTARAYAHAVHRFLKHADQLGLSLHEIPPRVVSDYIRGMQCIGASGTPRPASKPTRKLHLAAIRLFLDYCVQRHAIMLNPALSVRGPRHSVSEGKTPAIDARQARALLNSIDLSRPIGIRDRAIIATLIFTAARVGAVAKLSRRDYFSDGRQRYLRFDEKGDKQRVIPVRHDLEGMLDRYLAETVGHDPDAPLFGTLRPLIPAGHVGQRHAPHGQAKDARVRSPRP
jgi:site-specific recombinase XerD